MGRARAMRALLLCACAALAAARKDAARSDPPATPADLPLLGVNGAPVMTVDGRVCAFPWTGADGTAHSACALLPTAAGDQRLWCKDAAELWGICAAPKAAADAAGGAAAKPAGAAAAAGAATKADAAQSPAAGAGASLPLMMQAKPSADVAPAPVAASASTTAGVKLFDAASDAAAAADAVAPAPAPSAEAVARAPPAPVQSLPPLRDAKGPVKLDAAGQSAVLRLRSQLATARASEAAATDDSSRASAAAQTSFVLQQLAAVQSGFLDASAVGGGGDANAPQCNALGRQCGGLQPGSNTETWAATTACCGNATCVQTDPNYAQCIPIQESRPRGCSALNAQCAGDYWEGPGCCAEGLGCMWQSKALSKCLTCPKLWEQCGGMENGAKWSKPSCCPSGAYCKQVNQFYSQCVKNGS